MASYCECGHVWAEHLAVDDDADPDAGACLECGCVAFSELSVYEYWLLDRGFD